MVDRECTYTVLLGSYETLLEQPAAAAAGAELICFTDDPGLTSDTWDVRPVVPRFALDPVRSARWVKLMAHRLLPDHDRSLYVDNSVLLTADPHDVLDGLLTGGAELAFVRHDFRDTLGDEFDEVDRLGFDAPWVLHEQRAHYAAGHPGCLELPVIFSGVLARRHHTATSVEVMTTWWDHVARYSRRDQLSLPVVLHALGVSAPVHDVGTHGSPWWTWPATQRHHRREALLPDGPEALAVAAQEAAAQAEAASARMAEEVTRALRLLEAERAAAATREHELGEQVADLRGLLVARAERLGEVGHRLDAVGAERDALAAGLAAALAELEAVRASTSWRVTAPLRDWRRHSG